MSVKRKRERERRRFICQSVYEMSIQDFVFIPTGLELLPAVNRGLGIGSRFQVSLAEGRFHYKYTWVPKNKRKRRKKKKNGERETNHLFEQLPEKLNMFLVPADGRTWNTAPAEVEAMAAEAEVAGRRMVVAEAE